MSYRVFIGDWSGVQEGAEPDWVHHDKPGLTWEEARAFLSERLAGFETDDCEYCRADAAQEHERLMKAQPGQFEAQVDGDDYVIIDESRGSDLMSDGPIIQTEKLTINASVVDGTLHLYLDSMMMPVIGDEFVIRRNGSVLEVGRGRNSIRGATS